MNALMLQGTGSDVGKSVLVAALCRIARQRGYRVAPFKPQNMSNNAHACVGGGEIGRAQALQAQAAGVEANVDMNPVLLKPQSDQIAQLVVQGRVVDTLGAQAYMSGRGQLLVPVMESFTRLAASYDLVIVEGAGSPAEINLRHRDIANMGFARAAGVPVCLVGDIDRGGVIAALAGTRAVLAADDARHIVSFLINKFRGNISLFADGVAAIEAHTQWPCWGVVPWLAAVGKLPAEDAVQLQTQQSGAGGRIKIVAPMLSRLANFDDMDPLAMEPDVDFSFLPPGRALPGNADVVILLGTKSTAADLAFLREQGWHHDIYAHVRRGGHVLGICGGYQMLGQQIIDEEGFDGLPGTTTGLGLLDVSTRMAASKTTRPVTATCQHSNQRLTGYEIHTGNTTGADTERPLFTTQFGQDGATDHSGRIQGCYLHGLFNEDGFRRAWLQRLSPAHVGGFNYRFSYQQEVEQALDELSAQVAQNVDIEQLLAAARPPGWQPR